MVVKGNTAVQDETEVEEDDEEDEEETEETEGQEQESKDKVDPLKAANEEAKRRRLQVKTERQRAQQLENELNELKNKDKTDTEKVVAERDQLKAKVEAIEPKYLELQKRHAVVVDALAMGFDQKQMKPLLRLMDLDSVEIEDDGTVSGVKEALEAAKNEFPALLGTGKNGNKGDGDDDKDDKEDLPSTGSRHNSRKGKPGQTSDADLAKKYPALGF